MKYQKNLKIVIASVCVVGVIGAGTVYVMQRFHREKSYFVPKEQMTGAENETNVDEFASLPENSVPNPKTVKVFVCGAVKNPSLYELLENSRVFDAVQAAGGLAEDANPDYVNQAAFIKDGERIYIPRLGEQLENGDDSASQISDGRVNLNTADLNTLMTLPGIGENKAKKILEYRNKMGRFTTTEEIMNVTGIGESIYQGLQDVIFVEPG